MRTVVFVLFKEPHIYADVLQITSRCAIRGILYLLLKIMLHQKRFPRDMRHFMVIKRVISLLLGSALVDERRCRAMLWWQNW